MKIKRAFTTDKLQSRKLQCRVNEKMVTKNIKLSKGFQKHSSSSGND